MECEVAATDPWSLTSLSFGGTRLCRAGPAESPFTRAILDSGKGESDYLSNGIQFTIATSTHCYYR